MAVFLGGILGGLLICRFLEFLILDRFFKLKYNLKVFIIPIIFIFFYFIAIFTSINNNYSSKEIKNQGFIFLVMIILPFIRVLFSYFFNRKNNLYKGGEKNIEFNKDIEVKKNIEVKDTTIKLRDESTKVY